MSSLNSISNTQTNRVFPPNSEWKDLNIEKLNSIIDGIYERLIVKKEWLNDDGKTISKDGNVKRWFLYAIAYIDVFDLFKLRTTGKTYQTGHLLRNIDSMLAYYLYFSSKGSKARAEILPETFIFKYQMIESRLKHVVFDSKYNKIRTVMIGSASYMRLNCDIPCALTGRSIHAYDMTEEELSGNGKHLYEGCKKAYKAATQLIENGFKMNDRCFPFK